MSSTPPTEALSVAKELASAIFSKKHKPSLPSVFRKGPAVVDPAVTQAIVEAGKETEVLSQDPNFTMTESAMLEVSAVLPALVQKETTVELAGEMTPPPVLDLNLSSSERDGTQECVTVLQAPSFTLTADSLKLPTEAINQEKPILPSSETVPTPEFIVIPADPLPQVQKSSDGITPQSLVPLSKIFTTISKEIAVPRIVAPSPSTDVPVQATDSVSKTPCKFKKESQDKKRKAKDPVSSLGSEAKKKKTLAELFTDRMNWLEVQIPKGKRSVQPVIAAAASNPLVDPSFVPETVVAEKSLPSHPTPTADLPKGQITLGEEVEEYIPPTHLRPDFVSQLEISLEKEKKHRIRLEESLLSSGYMIEELKKKLRLCSPPVERLEAIEKSFQSQQVQINSLQGEVAHLKKIHMLPGMEADSWANEKMALLEANMVSAAACGWLKSSVVRDPLFQSYYPSRMDEIRVIMAQDASNYHRARYDSPSHRSSYDAEDTRSPKMPLSALQQRQPPLPYHPASPFKQVWQSQTSLDQRIGLDPFKSSVGPVLARPSSVSTSDPKGKVIFQNPHQRT